MSYDTSKKDNEKSFILKTLKVLKDAEARQSVLTLHIQEVIANISNIPSSDITPDKALIAQLGMDSLRAAQMRNELESSLGKIEFEMADMLIKGLTITELAEEVDNQLAIRNFEFISVDTDLDTGVIDDEI